MHRIRPPPADRPAGMVPPARYRAMAALAVSIAATRLRTRTGSGRNQQAEVRIAQPG